MLGQCRRCREEQLRQGAREEEVVEEVYIGETHRSLVTREVRREEGISPEEDKELRKAGSWMREHAYSNHGGEFSEEKTKDYEFAMLGVHRIFYLFFCYVYSSQKDYSLDFVLTVDT